MEPPACLWSASPTLLTLLANYEGCEVGGKKIYMEIHAKPHPCPSIKVAILSKHQRHNIYKHCCCRECQQALSEVIQLIKFYQTYMGV